MLESDLVEAGCAVPVPRSDGQAIYLYAFVDGLRAHRFNGDGCGDGSRPLSLHRIGPIGAVVRTVALDDFCGPAGEAKLSDPAWLAPRAYEHAAVIDRVLRWSPVFPLGFGTLFASLASLAAFTRRHEAAITTFLSYVRNKEEWGVRFTAALDRHQILEGLAIETWPEWRALTPGTRYLRLRHQQAALTALARTRAVRLMDEIIDGVRPVAAEVRQLPLSGQRAVGQADAIGNWALLVDCGRSGALKDRLTDLPERAALHDIRLTLSGPWPPFSFRPGLNAAGASIAS